MPRFGAVYDLQGNGKTVLKANFGRFYFNPGVNLADSVNPNTSDQYSVYAWSDPNGNGAYDVGEEGVLSQRFGGTQNAFIDENLSNSYSHEFSTFLERELITNLGVRVGYVWKKDYNGYQTMNALRPSSLFNVPVTVVDPGVDGTVGTSDDGTIQALNIQTPIPGSRNVTMNVDGYEGTYKTLEVALNKRFSNRWSATLSYSYIKSAEFARIYAGNAIGSAVSGSSLFGGAPNNPNDRTFNEYDNWNMKLHGTVDVGWGIRVTPVIKAQSGQPFGRVVSAALNYGTQLILVEPIGTRRQENIVATDVRAEKYFTSGRQGQGRPVRRRVQPHERQPGVQHQLDHRTALPVPVGSHAAADHEDRCEGRFLGLRAARPRYGHTGRAAPPCGPPSTRHGAADLHGSSRRSCLPNSG